MSDFAPESPLLNIDPALGEYLARLERRVEEAFRQIHDFGTLHVEPSKRSDGMVRHADGADWDPGYGKGLYFYNAPLERWEPAFFVTEKETDPVFTASPSYLITLTEITNWNVAYGWGDHSVVGYLTEETTLTDAGAGDESLIVDGNGPTLSLRTLSAGDNITLTEAAEDIVIASPDGSFQMVGGEGCFDAVSSLTDWPDLYLKDFCASSGIQISQSAQNLTWATVDAEIDHNNLLNYVAAEHINWTVTGAEQVHADRLPIGSVNHDGLAGLGDDDHTQYHNDTRGDARYYTKTLLDAGQLDSRYYTETEVDALTWDASDIVTGTFADARIAVTNVTQHQGSIDHGSIAGLTDDDHTQYVLAAGTRAITGTQSFNVSAAKCIEINRTTQTNDRALMGFSLDSGGSGGAVGEIRGDYDNSSFELRGFGELVLRATGSSDKVSFEVGSSEVAAADSDGMRVVQSLKLTVLSAAPTTPVEGMICAADRVTWDPASKGSGNSYPVYYNGSSWQALY